MKHLLAYISSFVLMFFFAANIMAQDGHNHNHDGHDHSGHDHSQHDHSGHNHDDHAGHDHASSAHGGPGHTVCGIVVEHGDFDAAATAFHHIADANVYSVGPFHLPLPCILYSTENGATAFLSSEFGHLDSHGTALKTVNGYALDEGTVIRVKDGQGYPTEGVQDINGIVYVKLKKQKGDKIEDKDVAHVCYQNKLYECERRQTADFGLFGGDTDSSFYDFSITKNVVSMFLVCLFLLIVFRSVASAYKKREGMAPKGMQSFFEPIIVFIRDDVAIPFIGKKKADNYLPFLLSVFFFILGLNLFGQVPFLGGSNVTGNLAVTMVLAVLVFLITTFSGNKHYWSHILWMPNVPAPVKILILTPVEILGMFIKPITLMLRLCANITAGHMVLVIFIGFIFLIKDQFGFGAGVGTIPVSILLSLFMMIIELIVAFVQAFVFTLLAASYFGAAVEEAHH